MIESYGNRFYWTQQAGFAQATANLHRRLRDVRDDAAAAGGCVFVPIYDEMTIVMPDDNSARRIVGRLARLMRPRPALPAVTALDPAKCDPVASFLVKQYGVPT